MSISKLDSEVFAPLFSDPEIGDIFSDAHFFACCIEVEKALAVVQARLGVIPAEAADTIGAAAFHVDMTRLRADTEKVGYPIIALVRQMRAQVSESAATYVHWGATTQDIMDSALVLQIRAALAVLERQLTRLIPNLARLADAHRTTLMAGRTHLQQALLIPFGLKVAAWLAPNLRDQQRLAEIKPRVLALQFGGAGGTLASLGAMGIQVHDALAAELKLNALPMHWHTQRDSLAEIAGWLSLVTGSQGKMAQDILLMAQNELGEVAESGDRSRGGSSAMPQKSNPIFSELILAAARTNATLLSAMHQALLQEHERGTHGWQIEWLTLPQMFALTATALNKAVYLSENLVVNPERMRQHVEASNGLMLAEAVTLALAPVLGVVAARRQVEEAIQVVIEENRHLVDVVREKTNANLDWDTLKDESAYFGASSAFIDRVLQTLP